MRRSPSALEPPVFAQRGEERFDELPKAELPDTRARGRHARERLEADGFDVLYVDCSPRDHSVGVVKVIVPGLEVETMSYYRIGERNTHKLLDRDSPLIRFGTPTEALRPVRVTPEALERFGRQPLLDNMLRGFWILWGEPGARRRRTRRGSSGIRIQTRGTCHPGPGGMRQATYERCEAKYDAPEEAID